MSKHGRSLHTAIVSKADVPPAWSAEQKRLAALRVDRDLLDWSLTDDGDIRGLKRIAGMDLSRFPDDTYAVATVVVLSYPELVVIYERSVLVRSTVPYIPGFLAFREVPPLAALLEELPAEMTPQVVFVDGNGAFHPRKCGAATHLGVATGFPTVGVAKKVQAIGDVNTEVARLVSRQLQSGGAWAPLIASSEISEAVAALLRPTSGRARPLVVSPGHRISLQTAAKLTAAVCRHSVAEPIRQADLRSRKAVRSWLAGIDLPTVRLREPGTKRRPGQASLLPVVNRLLKQGRLGRCATVDPLSTHADDEDKQNCRSCGWSCCYEFFSWLLFRSIEAIAEPVGAQIHEEPLAPRPTNDVAAENAAAEVAEEGVGAAATLTPLAATENSAALVSLKPSAVGGAKSQNAHPKKFKVPLKWRPKVT